MMNFFIYRKPDEQNSVGSMSRRISNGIARDSFVIAPFRNEDNHIFSIPFESGITSKDIDRLMDTEWEEESCSSGAAYPFPERSTSKEEHGRLVTLAIDEIKSGNLEKCVVSRAILRKGGINLSETFDRLCSAYPDAFVFCFYTRYTGLWMGATPERLLSKTDKELRTMALAGTMPAESNLSWDEKNIKEHEVVVDFIAGEFSSNGLKAIKEHRRTINAGPVKHLMTSIKCEGYNNGLEAALSLARSLSPSPALSGMPRDKACDLIEENETYKRGYYGGFVGPLINDDFEFFVNLRSMQIKKNCYCQYAGGGIMRDSECDVEWDETERKADTLVKFIVLK